MKLNKHQREYLKYLVQIQELKKSNSNYWNNGIRSIIDTVLFTNEYDDNQQLLLNQMNDRYSQYLKIEKHKTRYT